MSKQSAMPQAAVVGMSAEAACEADAHIHKGNAQVVRFGYTGDIVTEIMPYAARRHTFDVLLSLSNTLRTRIRDSLAAGTSVDAIDTAVRREIMGNSVRIVGVYDGAMKPDNERLKSIGVREEVLPWIRGRRRLKCAVDVARAELRRLVDPDEMLRTAERLRAGGDGRFSEKLHGERLTEAEEACVLQHKIETLPPADADALRDAVRKLETCLEAAAGYDAGPLDVDEWYGSKDAATNRAARRDMTVPPEGLPMTDEPDGVRQARRLLRFQRLHPHLFERVTSSTTSPEAKEHLSAMIDMKEMQAIHGWSDRETTERLLKVQERLAKKQAARLGVPLKRKPRRSAPKRKPGSKS